jgi:hypothetical protein
VEHEKSFVTPSPRGTEEMMFTNRKSNVNETPIKELQDDNRQRRKAKSVPACHEQDHLRVPVSRFGGLSETAKLDISEPCCFSKKGFSESCWNKCLGNDRTLKVVQKYKENVKLSINSSLYSDFDETDSDNDLSWLEP